MKQELNFDCNFVPTCDKGGGVILSAKQQDTCVFYQKLKKENDETLNKDYVL